MKLRIHPLFLLFGVISCFRGTALAFVEASLAALLHECGHSLYAARLGYALDTITLMPYGAVVSGEPVDLRKREEILLLLAGPLVNFLTAFAFVGLWWFVPDSYPYTETAAQTSFLLGVVNLLPAKPLDGGRVLFCLTEGKAWSLPLLYIFTVLVTAGFFILGIGQRNFSLVVFGIFICMSFFTKDGNYLKIDFSTRNYLRGAEQKIVAVRVDTPLRAVMRFLDRKSVLLVAVYDKEETLVATFTQSEYCKLLKAYAIYTTFGEIVCKKSDKPSKKVLSQVGQSGIMRPYE